MRILQLVTRRQLRGAEVFAAHLSDALVARGHEVVLVGLYPPAAVPLMPEAAEVHDLGLPTGLSITGLSALAAYLRRYQPHVVQANGSDTFKYSALAKRLLRARWPLVYRNISLASYWLRHPGQRLWGRWLARAVDHVASVSEESRVDFARTYGMAPSRTSTLRRGVHIPAHDGAGEARKRLTALAAIPGDAEILVHIGSLTPEKNHLGLIEALDRVRRQREDAHLLLFGEGPQRETIERAIGARGLQQHVHLLGSRADADQLVAGADLLLLSSQIEGIPGVILEAAARGVPSVSTAVGGVAEAVRDGETGILVPSADVDGFAAAVVALLGDVGRRQRMGAAARDFVRRAHGMETTIDAFECLYQKLLRTREAGSASGRAA